MTTRKFVSADDFMRNPGAAMSLALEREIVVVDGKDSARFIITRKVEPLDDENDVLRRQIEKLKGDNANLETELERLRAKLADGLHEEHDKLRATIGGLSGELKEARKKVDVVTNDLNNAQIALSAVQSDRDQWKIHAQNAAKDTDNARQTYAVNRQRHVEARTKLERRINALREVMDHVAELLCLADEPILVSRVECSDLLRSALNADKLL